MMVVGDFFCPECGSENPPSTDGDGAFCQDCGRSVDGTKVRIPIFKPKTDRPKKVLSEEHKAAMIAGRKRALEDKKNAKKAPVKDPLEAEMLELVQLGRDIRAMNDELCKKLARFDILKKKFKDFVSVGD
jgi:hypothetical protein